MYSPGGVLLVQRRILFWCVKNRLIKYGDETKKGKR